MKLGYDLLARFQVELWGNLLWTTGGESSITLMLVFLRLSRRQRVNAFKAALEAEYAGSVAAGMMARWLPVLLSSDISQSWYWVAYLQDDSCWSPLGFEEGDESMDQGHITGEIGVDLSVELCKVHSLRFGEIGRALNAGVEEEAIDVGWFGHNTTQYYQHQVLQKAQEYRLTPQRI